MLRVNVADRNHVLAGHDIEMILGAVPGGNQGDVQFVARSIGPKEFYARQNQPCRSRKCHAGKLDGSVRADPCEKEFPLPIQHVKCREAADCYTHAAGAEIQQTIDQARHFMDQGFRNVRVQVGVPGMAGYGAGPGAAAMAGLDEGPVFEPAYYIRRALKLFEECRKQLGEDVELLHDVHERVSPNQAVQFLKDAEKFKMFFMEDPLSPEDIDYFRQIRSQCATPIAMGELFNSPHEWTPLITGRLIDYIRIHVTQAGGLTPVRKIAAMAEIHGVKTAWHGPGDVSPVGHAANVTLDLICYNFGIQEYSPFNDHLQEVFRGCPVMKNGYLYANEAPGWGIEVDEKLAAKYPYGASERGERQRLNGGWGEVRRRDGSIIKQ